VHIPETERLRHNLTLAPGSTPGGVAAYADLTAAATTVATVTYTISDN
jgi:hypothetical protein